MGINKNFVVKNGFEVSTDLILADANTRKVGIGTTLPQRELQVAGGIGATDFYLTGIGTFANELNVGLGGTAFTASSFVKINSNLEVTGITTTTNIIEVRSNDSTPGRIDYYCEVGNAHYTRIQAAPHAEYSGNATVILPTVSGDFVVGDTSSAISQNLNTTGVITATSFVGDGSNITGISTLNITDYGVGFGGGGSGGIDGIEIRDDGSVVGTAATIDFGTNLSVSPISAGVATITASSTSVETYWVSNAIGIHTLSNVGVGTTNPTSAVTVQGDISVSGVVTATSFTGDGSGLTGLPGAGSTVFDDTTTNQEFFPLFTDITTGTITSLGISTSKLTYNPSTGTITVVDLNTTSDISLKENIHTVENALETVSSLRGVSFDWKETGKGSYGVIAQELEEVLPELVKNGEIKSVNYNGIIGVLIEAIKELKKEIEILKSAK